jgi:hypothetical protein
VSSAQPPVFTKQPCGAKVFPQDINHTANGDRTVRFPNGRSRRYGYDLLFFQHKNDAFSQHCDLSVRGNGVEIVKLPSANIPE